MKRVIVPVLLLAALASGQWSVPADVGVDTALHYAYDFQLVAASGDTLWAFYRTDDYWPDTNHAFAHWSTGDFWSGPQVLVSDMSLYHLAAGVDPQGRVWLSWYNGEYLVDGDTWGIWTRVRDSLGWQPVRLALPGPEGVMAFPAGQYFAADKHGTWYMGICEEHAPLPDLYTSALYSRFQGDTWNWPRVIAQGYGSPAYVDYGLPSLVARPDTGLWAVYEHWTTMGAGRLLVDHLVPDTTLPVAHLDSSDYHAATADSSGHLWIVFLDPAGTLWSATFDTGGVIDRRIVTTDRRWSEPMVCTDPLGWVWTCWTRSDTTPVVSYNRGNGWSTPEAVTDLAATAADITSDRNGRIYVGFRDMQYRCLTSYRTSRPGIENEPKPQVPSRKLAATIIGSLPVGAVAFDAMGRRVLNPKSGVYFLRVNDGWSPARVRKVVIQR
jgi:hypothetical protein